MSDAVLIYPKSSYLEKGMKNQYLPLSLLSISRYATLEFDIKIIDQRINNNWKKDLLKELNQNPLCVGVSSLTGEQINHGIEVSKFVKQHSNIPIVWGGTHASLLPEQTLNNKFVDFVIIGEGELTFHELLRSLRRSRDFDKIEGLWYKKEGKTKKNKLRKIQDMNNLPDVPYHLVNVKDYIQRLYGRKRFILETSRGCTNRCQFCYYSSTIADFNRWRSLNPDKALDQIRYLIDKFRINDIEFIDDNFFVNMNRVSNILQEVSKLDLTWTTAGRISSSIKMDDNFLRLMRRSGLYRLGQGVETGSQRILTMINKGITLEQIKTVSKRFTKFKIPALYALMLGFPTETVNEMKDTTKLAVYLLKQNKNARISIMHCFRPLPNNKLFDMAIKMGLKEPKNLEEWGKYSMDYANLPWLSTKTQKFIQNLNFVSLFVDKKYEEVDSSLVKLFSRIYKPIAFYRMQNLNFNLMFEPKIKDIFVNLS
jgi:radical SAM superfamily enzyme YgiQ (UPF0313 family)